MRNAAAARIGESSHVIAALVDTSGYSSEVRAKYEGFFINSAPIKIGDTEIGIGAYGFGFSNDGKMKLYDVSGRQLAVVNAAGDRSLKRPRPLMMTADAQNGLRLYSGRSYVTLAVK